MRHKSQFLKVLFISILFVAFANENTDLPTNKEITYSFIEEFSDTLSKLIQTTNKTSFSIITLNHPLSNFLESVIIPKLHTQGYKFHAGLNDTTVAIQISVNKYNVSYKRIVREKPTNQIIRKIEIEIASLLKTPDGAIEPKVYQKMYQDTVAEENLDYVEKDGAPFTGKKPKEPENFLKKYIEPIVIIGSSALAIFLFFTIRSK